MKIKSHSDEAEKELLYDCNAVCTDVKNQMVKFHFSQIRNDEFTTTNKIPIWMVEE